MQPAVGWLGTKAILKSGANYCQDLLARSDLSLLGGGDDSAFFSVYVKRSPLPTDPGRFIISQKRINPKLGQSPQALRSLLLAKTKDQFHGELCVTSRENSQMHIPERKGASYRKFTTILCCESMHKWRVIEVMNSQSTPWKR